MIYTSGRDSEILKYIKDGTKTVEIRLNRGKFKDYKPGDRVNIREDFYEDGKLVNSIENQAITEIVKVEMYPTFKDAISAVGFKQVIPWASSIDEAVEVAYRFYTKEEEKEFNVLAIHFKLVN